MIPKNIEKRPFFSRKDAESEGLSSRMIAYYLKDGRIERIRRGIYRCKDSKYSGDFQWEDLVVVANTIPNSVVCLISALKYYNLTDEFMRELWIAVPNNQQNKAWDNVRLVRMRNMELGVKVVKEGGITIKIFDPERTIIDSFRLLDLEIAVKALKAYVTGTIGKPNYKKLSDYAKKLRFNITPYLQSLIT
ncbi:MAG: type IV toxin-antitoxin system AbiEi family antitoxin domain-containing protein [bacterium]